MAPRKHVEPHADQLLTRAEHYAAGKTLRDKCPRDSHGVWRAEFDKDRE